MMHAVLHRLPIRRSSATLRTALAGLTIVVATPSADAADWYVDGDAPGATGESWATAFRYLGDALRWPLLAPGDRVLVRAASQPYLPSSGASPVPDRCAAFVVPAGVGVYGGFDGGETTFDERDPARNVTVLSGAIGGPGPEDNSLNVVRIVGRDVGTTTVLDGFVIREGYASAVGPLCPEAVPTRLQQRGGGVLVADGATPIIRNCTIEANEAELRGGGMSIVDADPIVQACRFVGNRAVGGGDINLYESGGGGLYAEYDELHHVLVVESCTFEGNDAGAFHGGGMSIGGPRPVPPVSGVQISNCLFIANTAVAGGGLYLHRRCNGAIRNCTFAGHTSFGALFEHALPPNELRNCIFWGNATSVVSDGNDLNVSDSIIEGGWPDGTNILAVDPAFVAPENGDYRLQPNSPAVDAGNVAFLRADLHDLDEDGDLEEPLPDLERRDRVVGPTVDLGAHEHAAAACDPAVDLDGDGQIGIAELLIVLNAWGECPDGCPTDACPADVNGDCVVDLDELLLVLVSWCGA